MAEHSVLSPSVTLSVFLCQCCGMTHQTSSLRLRVPLKFRITLVRMSAVQERARVVYCAELVICVSKYFTLD
jgi:hypothetical protein